jgi:uncharacterized membrane protein
MEWAMAIPRNLYILLVLFIYLVFAIFIFIFIFIFLFFGLRPARVRAMFACRASRSALFAAFRASPSPSRYFVGFIQLRVPT